MRKLALARYGGTPASVSALFNYLVRVINDIELASHMSTLAEDVQIEPELLAGYSNLQEALADLLSDSAMAQRTIGTYAANSDLTAAIPGDDSIPDIGEGTEIIAVTHTPLTTTNILRCTFSGLASADAAGRLMGAAVFKTGTAAALAVSGSSAPAANYLVPIVLRHEFVAGTTDPVPLVIRAGPDAGTMRFNGTTGARRYGGAMYATLLVEEIRAS